MAKITCLPDNRLLEINPSETILETLLNHDISHTNICGGKAYCSTCRIMILDGIDHCSAPTNAEIALTKKLDFPFHIRLACQTKVSGPVSIRRLVIDQDDLDIVDNQLTSGAITNDRSVALLVASIRGATNFDEVNFHYDIVYIMSRYFHRIKKIIEGYEGAIPNVMGVRVLAIFGIKENSINPVENAIWAGLEILKAVEELNIFLQQMSYLPIVVNIGIHYGPTVLVPIGSTQLTPLGGAANIANRLELANQDAGTQLLVSEAVYPFVIGQAMVGQNINLSSDNKKPFKAYEILGMKGNPPKIKNYNLIPAQQRILSFIQKFTGFLGKSN